MSLRDIIVRHLQMNPPHSLPQAAQVVHSPVMITHLQQEQVSETISEITQGQAYREDARATHDYIEVRFARLLS